MTQQDVKREFKKLDKIQRQLVRYYLQHPESRWALWVVLSFVLPPGTFKILQGIVQTVSMINIALKVIQEIEKGN